MIEDRKSKRMIAGRPFILIIITGILCTCVHIKDFQIVFNSLTEHVHRSLRIRPRYSHI